MLELVLDFLTKICLVDKNTMKDSIIFNWSSGCGGDFIMSIVHLANKTGVTPIMHYSNNKFNSNDENSDNVIRTFGLQEPIKVPPHDMVVYTHCLNLYTNMLSSNVKIVNIDNSKSKYFTDLLLLIKSKKSQVLHSAIFDNELISNYHELFDNIKDYNSFCYYDIMSDQPNIEEVKRLYSIFDVQITSEIIDCIILYSKINYIMIKNLTLDKLENLPDKNAYNPSYDLTSIKHLKTLLEKKLNEIS